MWCGDAAQLEADLARAWGLDPVIAAQISQTRGTRRVHEKKQRSNSHILKLKLEARVGFESTNGGFADSSWISILLLLPLHPRHSLILAPIWA